MKLKRIQKLFSDNISEDVIKEFLGRLSGFVHKAKSLHWAASGKDIHEYLDEIWKALYEFQDTVAEGWMGINGQLDSDIPFLMPESKNPESFIREVEEKTTDAYNLLPDDPKYSGLKGEFESFIQTIEKYKYLFGLTEEEKEFSEKEGKGKETAAVIGSSAGLIIGGAALKRKGNKLISESIKADETVGRKVDEAAQNMAKDIFSTEHPSKELRFFEDGRAGYSEKGLEQFRKIKKEAMDAVKESGEKYMKGTVRQKVGKGLLIAGATLPAAYVIHRKKIKKKEKRADLEKLENGKMTKAEFVEKYKK